jgi:uncharacterized membrane protein YgdD (TMEM256/DUF423 family)
VVKTACAGGTISVDKHCLIGTDMTSRILMQLAAVAGFLAVGLGAFGAHALNTQLSAASLQTWDTAVSYQFYHTLALLALALSGKVDSGSRWFGLAAKGWLLGMLLFSGSLYGYCLSQFKPLVYITPVGGLCFLLGWFALTVAGYRAAELRS